jgi:hypothetical protein
MLCSFLAKYKHLKETLLDLPSVINNKELMWDKKMNVEDRCSYNGGNMFNTVPGADAYMMKMILHDWNDEECIQILSNCRKSAPSNGLIFIIEHIVPSPDTPHFAKLFDIHMMCWGTGRERTEEEYVKLLEKSGWMFTKTWFPQSRIMGVIEGVKA